MADIRKALDMTAAGNILVQPEIDKEIAQLVNFQNPLRVNLPRKPGSGAAWILNRRTPSAATPPAWIGDLEAVPRGEGDFVQVTFPYKTIAAGGAVSRRLQAAGQTYRDILADEIEARTLEFKNAEEKAYIQGDATANPKEIDGLHKLIPSDNIVGTTGATSGGAPLTLAKLDEAIDKCIGTPTMLVMSSRTKRRLVGALQAQQRFVEPTIEVKGGFKLISYNDIPIYVSNNVPDTMTWNGETGVAGLTGGSLSAIYIVDTTHTWVGELTPVKFARVNTGTIQYDAFEIVCDEVLVVRNPYANAMLAGIQ